MTEGPERGAAKTQRWHAQSRIPESAPPRHLGDMTNARCLASTTTALTLALASSALAVTLASGCGGASPAPPDAPAAPGPDLAGRWRSACVDPGNGQAFRLTFDLTATTWDLAYEAFGDAACGSPFLTVRITGPYTVQAPSATVAGAHEARFDFGTRTVTPASAAAVGFLGQACGGGTFTVGTATDISTGCAGLGAYPHGTCASDFDLVARDGDTLRFGKRPADNNMCTEAKRPTELSPVVLTRS